MGRGVLELRDRRRLADLIDVIDRYDGASIVPTLGRELRSLLGAEVATIYRPTRTVEGWDIDFIHVDGHRSSIVERMTTLVRGISGQFVWFDPVRPEPQQRNVALPFTSIVSWEEFDASQIGQRVFRPEGLHRHEQFRTLLCDGELLLAWVGVFTTERVGVRERKLLESLTASLRRRFVAERQIGLLDVYAHAASAALDALPTPALLVRADGHVVHANAIAQQLLDAGGLDVAEVLLRERTQPDGDPTICVLPLNRNGIEGHYLVTMRAPRSDGAARIANIAARWGLTPAQAVVVGHIVRGESNKEIAERLGRSESTIEYHVTAILRRAGVSSRGALITKFWSEHP